MREDGLDRRTDDPDESGGASPTVVTSRQDGDDPIADDGRDARPVSIMVPSPLMPRNPGDAPGIPSAWNAPAVGSLAGENGKDGSDAVVTEAADDALAEPDPLGSSALGSSAFDSSAFSFSAPDPSGLDSWATGPVSWSLSDTDESSAGSALATDPPAWDEPDTSLSFEQPSFGASYTPRPAVSEPPSPDPPAVSAAAFTWDTPEPPPTSPSSPARTFLRSAGNVKPPAPARPAVTAPSPQKPAPAPAPAPAAVRRAPAKAAAKRSVRQAHLTIARVEPWSVMKFSFVVSLVAFVILFVVVTVLWGSLSALGVFDSLQRVVANVTSSQASNGVNAAKWFSASRILGWTALLGSINIVLITAMSTIGAVVYNLTSRLVGGVEVTLRETE
jgi:Transmembrane domain of unknown function (DUF3566)